MTTVKEEGGMSKKEFVQRYVIERATLMTTTNDDIRVGLNVWAQIKKECGNINSGIAADVAAAVCPDV